MECQFQGGTVTLPDFLIVGAAKSGTTSLYYYLSSNGSVFFPKVKEPHFFTFYNNKPHFESPENLPTVVAELANYQKLISPGKGKLIGEASQSYLYSYKQVISNMRLLYGADFRKVKIIIVLRNPLERAWSQYWHFRKNFNENLECREAVHVNTITQRLQENWNIFYDYLGFGHYSEQVKAYQEAFDHVKVLLYDDLKEKPEQFMKEVSSFLEIENLPLQDKTVYNASGLPKKNFFGFLWKMNSKNRFFKLFKPLLPLRFRKKLSNAIMRKSLEKQPMPKEVKKDLANYYEKEIEALYQIIKDERILTWNHKNFSVD